MRRRYQRPQRPQGQQQGPQRPPPNAPPIQRKDGIKARSQRGQFVTNWWAQRWISALERVVNSGRLNRGRTYARAGQVLSLDEVGGVVKARVQGTRPQPYKVTIKLKPLSDRQWDKVIDALSGQALFAAQLLAGEMPQEIDAVFAAAGSSLFPSTEGELETECSCPDWANPCKHVAATHYILAEQLDEDPFLLFRLRGRTQEQVMAALRARRSDTPRAAAEPAPADAGSSAPPLDANLEHFWRMGGGVEGVETTPIQVAIKPPATPLPLLKRLGQPPFLDENIEQVLGPAYRGMQQAALAAAFEGED
ncbi:MAG: SWIM zinc finger family protein [Caldilineaceae bacterium]